MGGWGRSGAKGEKSSCAEEGRRKARTARRNEKKEVREEGGSRRRRMRRRRRRRRSVGPTWELGPVSPACTVRERGGEGYRKEEEGVNSTRSRGRFETAITRLWPTRERSSEVCGLRTVGDSERGKRTQRVREKNAEKRRR